MLLWLTFRLLQVFPTCNDNLCCPCLMYDRLSVIYGCFVYNNMVYVSVPSKWATYVYICSFVLSKTLFILVYSRCMSIPNACVGRAGVLDDFGIPFLCQIRSLVKKIKSPTSLWLLVDVWNFPRYLYTCWVQTSLLIPPSHGVGWRFSYFSNLVIISCEPFLYWYT